MRSRTGSERRLAELEIVEEIGRGAWTVVYRARRDDVDYALRVLDAPVVKGDQALLASSPASQRAGLGDTLGAARVHESGLRMPVRTW